jgi:hypothetical protein
MSVQARRAEALMMLRNSARSGCIDALMFLVGLRTDPDPDETIDGLLIEMERPKH